MYVRVLLVESQEPLRRIILWILDEAGFEVESAATPTVAADRLREYDPDVVVIDTSTVSEKDWSAIARLGQQAGVLALAPASGRREHPGIDAVIYQPFDADTLVEAVSALAEADGEEEAS